MKLRSIVLAICLLIAISLMTGCLKRAERLDLIASGDISEIKITNLETKDSNTITMEEFSSFAEALNSATRYRDDVGSTLPIRADITLSDGSTIVVWGGEGDFYTVEAEKTQYNVKSSRLGEWIKSPK